MSTPHGLGRLHRPDSRDRDYLMDRRLAETAPTGRRLWDVPHLYDQGQTPQCTAYAASGALSAVYWAGAAGADVSFDAPGLYAWEKANDGEPGAEGSTVRQAFKGLVAVGDAVAASTDPADPPGTYDRAQGYLWADMAAPGCDIDRIVTWILTVSPVVVGVPWYSGMWDPNRAGYLHPAGRVVGGHAICVRGARAPDVKDTIFVVRNSWGRWGVHVRDDWTVDLAEPAGDALIHRSDLIRLLSEQGEAGALVDRL